METSGYNRYELLFMDDDNVAPTIPTEVEVKKKPSSTATTAAPKKAQAVAPPNKKSNTHSEKENKAGTLNKSDGKKVAVSGGGNAPRVKQGAPLGGNKKRLTDEESLRVTFRTERQGGGETSEQHNRRNFREGGIGGVGGDFSNDQRQQRQFKDKDSRGPPRNRFGENGYRSGKREFDRQSGSDKTGIKSVDKRDGAGAHNWGSVKQEIEDINKSSISADAEPTLTDKEESANDQSVDPTTMPEEEDTKEMTLDEWKAMRQERTKPQFNIRKAGEGEDTTQWKKMVVLNKKKEGGDSEDELEYDPSMYPQRVGRLQRIVDIQFTFNDGRRGAGGFGRGRGRGTRFAGGDRGGRFENVGRGSAPVDKPLSDRPRNFGNKLLGGATNALKVDDERQFPTLS